MHPAQSSAMTMALQGFHVFPLVWDGGALVPAWAAWNDRATASAWDVSGWSEWSAGCTAYGVVPHGMTVVDIDPRHGGDVSARMLAGLSTPTMTVRTKRGGLHLYYAGETATTAGKLGKGIDTRSGRTGYVVGPGSECPEGSYQIECDAPIAPVPPDVAGAAITNDGPALTAPNAFPVDDPEMIERARAAIRAKGVIAEGGRNVTAHRLALDCRDWGLSERTTYAELLGLETSPPLPRRQIQTLVGSAYRGGRNEPGCKHPCQDVTVFDIPDPVPAASVIAATTAELFGSFADIFSHRHLEPLPWLVDGMLMRGSVTGLVAPGGVGKSAFVLATSAALANADAAFFGLVDVPRCRVLVINKEDATQIASQRLEAALSRYDGNGRADVHMPRAVENQSIKMFVRNPLTKEFERTPFALSVIAYCKAERIDVLALDPFRHLHNGQENDNGDVAAIMEALAALAREIDAAVLVVHHTRKPGEAGSAGHAGNADSASGAGAFTAHCRVLLTLYPATAKEGADLNCEKGQHTRLIRLDNGKSNYGPRSGDPVWYEKQSHEFDAGGRTVCVVPYAGSTQEMRDATAESLLPHVQTAADGLPVTEAIKIMAPTGTQFLDTGETGQSEGSWRRRIERRFADGAASSAGLIRLDRSVKGAFRLVLHSVAADIVESVDI